MLRLLPKALDLLGPDSRTRWLGLTALGIVASALEVVGALLVYGVVAVMADPQASQTLPVVGNLGGSTTSTPDDTFLVGLAVALGAFVVLRAALQIFFAYAKNRAVHNAASRLASRLMLGYLRLPYGHQLQRNSSELIRNAHRTVEDITRNCFLQLIIVVSESFMVLALLAVLLVMAPLATGLVVLIMGGAALLLLALVQPRLKELGYTTQAMHERTLRDLQQSLHGIREIKVHGVAEAFGDHFADHRGQLSRALYLHGTVSELPRHIIETALMTSILLLFTFGVLSGTGTDALFSTLGLFAYAGLRLQPSVQRLVGGLNSLRYSAPAVEDLHQDIQLINAIPEGPPPGPALPLDDALVFRDVAFTYDGAALPAISAVDLTIRPGELLGICGPTGGGKTTLTDLIAGLLEPTGGEITIDGQPLGSHVAEWQRSLGLVSQDVFLADTTLRANIALGVDDDAVDEDALQRAVAHAQLTEFVAASPDGLDTVVGERGVRLSGGQRQRVAIARALYHDPQVLLFDEGTSALDTKTEAALVESLENLRGQRTMILVAHRMSSVRNCDRIVYVEDGRIRAVGTFDGLRSTSPGFRSLLESRGHAHEDAATLPSLPASTVGE